MLAAVAVAEGLVAWADPLLGTALYAAVLVWLFFHAGLTRVARLSRLALALALVPLMRVIGMVMPLADFQPVGRYLLVMVPLLVAIALLVYYLPWRPADLGLSIGASSAWATYLPVTLTGLPFGILEYSILRPAPFAVVGLSGGLSVVALGLAVGFSEELLLRGVLLRAARELLGDWSGILYVSLLWTVLQIGYNSWSHMLLTLGVGLFFGWVVARTRTIIPVSLAHGFANMIIFGLRPL